MADARRALLEEEGEEQEDVITTPRRSGPGVAVEQPRSPLSRIASMDQMHMPPLERPRNNSLCEQASCWFAATLLLGVLAVVALVAVAFPLPAATAQAPACRKSAAVAVLQPTRGNATDQVGQQLVVWSGLGHSDYLFHDLHVFSLTNLTWAKIKEKGADAAGTDADAAPSQQRRAGGWLSMPSPIQQPGLQRGADGVGRSPLPPPPMSLPRPRWKAAVAQADDLGMWLHGGFHPGKADSSSSTSSSGISSRWWRRRSDDGGGSMADDEQLEEPAAPGQFLADTWLLSFPELRWHAAHANCSSSSSGGACPSARRSHTATSFKDEQGRHVLLVFGGRRDDGVLLNDVWAGTLLSPPPPPSPPQQEQPSDRAALGGGSLAINWRLLHDPQAGVGEGPAPLPRSGHAAVALNGSHLLVHGGRSEVYGAFGDVWAFDVATSRWTPLRPATAVAPAPRDHHVAALAADGRLLVVGGRVGPPSGPLRPASDRWLFSLATSTWLQLPIHGLGPLPRYLASAVVQRSPGGDHLLMFGGETGSRCKLNDVWRFHLQLLKWEQLSPAAFATPQCRKTYD